MELKRDGQSFGLEVSKTFATPVPDMASAVKHPLSQVHSLTHTLSLSLTHTHTQKCTAKH